MQETSRHMCAPSKILSQCNVFENAFTGLLLSINHRSESRGLSRVLIWEKKIRPSNLNFLCVERESNYIKMGILGTTSFPLCGYLCIFQISLKWMLFFWTCDTVCVFVHSCAHALEVRLVFSFISEKQRRSAIESSTRNWLWMEAVYPRADNYCLTSHRTHFRLLCSHLQLISYYNRAFLDIYFFFFTTKTF